MVRARCWNLRLNLDLFNSGFAALDDDKDKSDFLTGMYKGFNGGRVKDDCSDPMSVGFAFGSEMRAEAEGFREKSIENGGKRKSNEKHQEVYLKVDQTVDQTGTQSPIPNPQSTNEVTTIPKEPSPSRARKSAGEKKIEQPIPPQLKDVVDHLISEWPTRSRTNGIERRVHVYPSPAALWKCITTLCRKHHVEPGPLLYTGILYLEEEKKKDDNNGNYSYIKNQGRFWDIETTTTVWGTYLAEATTRYNAYIERCAKGNTND